MPLTDIQKLQFTNKTSAEEQLLNHLKHLEDDQIQTVELMPRPESLNSINGFITFANQERYFFKAHVEENEQLPEYYNAELLRSSGYPVIATKQVRQRPGQQIAIYEIITLPTVFNLLNSEEDTLKKGGRPSQGWEKLLNAQFAFDSKLLDIYMSTWQMSDEDQHARAPIHQLFSHRLADNGRLGLFYQEKQLPLQNSSIGFEYLAQLRWTINETEYSCTLSEIIARATTLLKPAAGPSIVGHGDAHNGNVFVDLDTETLSLFDPAFAGRHDPILDLAKPLFHNVFARWMYFPSEVEEEFELSYKLTAERIVIDHTFRPSELRISVLRSKLKNTLIPLLSSMRARNLLRDTWREYLRSALFCCPFLTVNLFSPHATSGTLAERYRLSTKLLGLSMAVEFGALSHSGSNELSDLIDEIFAQD